MAHQAMDANNNIIFMSSTGTGVDAGNAITVDVAIENFPSTQTVDGSISVSNFPGDQTVSVAALPGTIASDVSAIKTAAEILDNAISGSEMQVDVVSLPGINVSPKQLLYATGIINSSGDNTVIDLSTVGSAGDNIAITYLIIQNESATPSTIILKDGGTAIMRFLGQSQGDGLAMTFAIGNEIRLSDDSNFIINISDANSHGYSIGYYLES